jgi:NADPH-dependent glutamate synthase beta subunit-like oxidoreductase
LRAVNLKQDVVIGNRVVVIGGGNVAVDVGLTALRMGAKHIQLACVESRDEMPAYAEEIQQALDEGIGILPSCGPKRIVGNGKVAGVELCRCTSVFDKAGNFNPCYDEGAARFIEADTVIVAVGQDPDLSLVPQDVAISKTGTLQVDKLTLETNVQGVFAGGDVASLRGAAIEAIAAGKRAALSIDRYLKGHDLGERRGERPRRISNPPGEGIELQSRQETPVLPVRERRLNFNEVKTGFDEDTMMLEARRCMTCGSRAIIRYPEECMACASCELNCPRKAIYVSPERHAPLMVSWR